MTVPCQHYTKPVEDKKPFEVNRSNTTCADCANTSQHILKASNCGNGSGLQ